MVTQQTDRMGPRHLSLIQEETNSREHSTSIFPPIIQHQETGGAEGAGGAGGAEGAGPSEAERRAMRRLSDPSSLEDNRSLLEELGRIEAGLRESLRLDMERQQEAEFLRQHEKKLLWQNLCYLSLNQRVAKPWVSSYFRKFPMHIYCLPVQAANHRGRRRGLKKKP